MSEDNMTFQIEGARIIFLNFSGRETMFKPEGYRSFSCVLPLDKAQELSDLGWNVKFKDPRDEGDEPEAHIEVAVGFKYKPPRIVTITNSARNHLNEETVGMLDHVDIETVDFIARAYNYDFGGKSGIKAYLQTMFVTIRQDALERKYDLNGPGQPVDD